LSSWKQPPQVVRASDGLFSLGDQRYGKTHHWGDREAAGMLTRSMPSLSLRTPYRRRTWWCRAKSKPA